jgi:hypothetical protein
MKPSILAAFILIIIMCIYSYLASLPVVGDAALYSQTILEVERTGKTTYLGYKETWKSPIFFYIYAFFDRFFNFLSFNPSLMVSFPCVLFFLISVFFFYKISRLFFDEKFSAIATLVFSINPISALIFSTPFNEAELMAFLLPSIYFYILALRKDYFLIPAGILFAISFGIKTYEALIVPLLAIFYFIEQKASKQKIFLLFSSFSFVVIPIFLNSFVFGIGEMFIYDLRHFFIGLENVASFIYDFFLLLFPFSIFSFFGFLKEESTRFFNFWFIFVFGVLIVDKGMPWYYSPVLPAIAVLTTKFFRKENKLDYLIILLILIFVVAYSFYMVKEIKTKANSIAYYSGEEEIKAAKILANKSKVLLLYYSPTFVYYYSFYSKYPLSVYWKIFLSNYTTEELKEAFSFKGENITSWNKWFYGEIKAIYTNPIQNISFVVLRDIDYSKNSEFFSKQGYYPYIIFSRILILKKY